MTDRDIPFNRPVLFGRELHYIAQAILNGHASGDGAYTRRCQALLEQLIPGPRVLLTTSCTHALEMCALLLDIQPGDEVIVPAYTFVTTANAFALRGARIVFADVCEETMNIDPRLLPGLITPRTKAVVVVHYAGIACDMDAIGELVARTGVALVEDNAHGLFGAFKGRHLGTFGALATQSFHETKNITCGEGGALLVNDHALYERAEIIREKGTNRSRFFRGQVDKYTWVGLGSSYVMSDILAAFLLAQIEAREQIMTARQKVWDQYHQQLQEWCGSHGVRQPTVPAECEQTYHMYYLVLPTLEARQRLIAHLRAHGILGVFHYQALNSSPAGQAFGGQPGQCPVAEAVSDRLIRLPLFNDLSESDQQRVIDAVTGFKEF